MIAPVSDAVRASTGGKIVDGRPAPAMTLAAITAGLAAILLLAGGGTARAADADAVVTHGRMQVLMASRPAAGYFTLQNNGAEPLVLSGASAPDCGSLMLHQSTTSGGMSRMAMVESVPVPPHGQVSFAPGGYHLMCMQPSGVLLRHTGTETVTLHFANGSSVAAAFAIQGVGASQGAGK
jgi:copper(I)-binding protein